MSGGSMTYRCERCSVILELGGYTAWDEHGTVYYDMHQFACGACGTPHRLTEEHGTCRLTALPGPVRQMRTVILRDVDDKDVETWQLAAEEDWRPVGPHPAGPEDTRHLTCHFCGQVGRMVTLADLRAFEGDSPGSRRREDCPLCSQPLECFIISEGI
jgi:hypothetical protein